MKKSHHVHAKNGITYNGGLERKYIIFPLTRHIKSILAWSNQCKYVLGFSNIYSYMLHNYSLLEDLVLKG